MQYRSGQQVRYPFTVPALDGSNTSGLTWTVSLFIKDGTVVTSGTEYDSIEVSDANENFYELTFTPASDSTAAYLIKLISDADPADVFEESFDVDWDWLFLYAEMEHDRSVSPETVLYKMPDGSTQLIKFRMTRDGVNIVREEV